MSELKHSPRPRVVIIGGGFGGLSAAKGLAGQPFDITLIDRNNHHLFQPLLYQVATPGLSPPDVAAPIRNILSGQRNTKVMLAEVEGVDLKAREVIIGTRRVPFDYLVIATGARHAYLGRDDWTLYAPGLKSIDDATYLRRRRILMAFERAENENDPDERRGLMTFAVIGGGPTGVEMAGAIAELAKRALAADFRSIDSRCARVILVEAASRVLTPFTEELSAKARRSLEQLGVEVRLGKAVTDCSCEGIKIANDYIPTRTIIWAAGVMASPAGHWLNAETDRVGRVKVRAGLSVPDHPGIFVIGDTASAADANGKPLPGAAPVAKQQGQYVARALIARQAGHTVPAFRYRDFGSLATIGRKRAIAQIGRLHLSGLPAWLLWSLAHIYFLIGFRNRFTVALNWGWSYITFERGSRLITGLYARPFEEVTRTAQVEIHSKAS